MVVHTKFTTNRKVYTMSVCPRVKDNVIVPDGVPNGTLFVCVTDTYGNGLKNPRNGKLVSLEDCARGFWWEANLLASHYMNCQWLAAHSKGKILGIWKIDQWSPMTEETVVALNRGDPIKPKRLYCSLKFNDAEVQKVQSLVVGKNVKLGRCPNPLRGFFVD
jgi:hypothetical protein